MACISVCIHIDVNTYMYVKYETNTADISVPSDILLASFEERF